MAAAPTATRQGKRAARAAPPPLEKGWGGCASLLLLFAAICAALYVYSGWVVWLVVGIPATALLIVAAASVIYKRALLALALVTLARRGVRCVVIHSQSPIWKDHIQDEWLPRLAARAVTLDWSTRARWPRSVPVALFECFVRAERNFNPAVIVLRGPRRPYVFRFFRAFHEAKHGRPSYLQMLEDEMFRAIDTGPPIAK